MINDPLYSTYPRKKSCRPESIPFERHPRRRRTMNVERFAWFRRGVPRQPECLPPLEQQRKLVLMLAECNDRFVYEFRRRFVTGEQEKLKEPENLVVREARAIDVRVNESREQVVSRRRSTGIEKHGQILLHFRVDDSITRRGRLTTQPLIEWKWISPDVVREE
jgi:hypothetical protein